jgi:RNA recognition motif. (a.k.a. RRM, RBD, or RNP domain)
VKRAQARGVAPPSIHQERPPFQQQQQPQPQQPVGPMLAPIVPTAGDSAAQPQQQPPPTSYFGGAGGASKPRSVFGQQQRDNELTPEQLHCKVFVGGIPHSVDRDELRQILSEFGTVVDSIIMVDQMTMRSRGFGFVTFSDAAGAERSIAAQPINIQGKMVEIKLATPRPERPPGDPSAAAAGGGGPKPFFQGGGGAGGAAVGAGYHQQYNKPGTYPNKFLGLRAGQVASNSEYAGFAVAYGRSGWKAGFGSRAFGRHGWDVQGWDDGDDDDENNGDENNKDKGEPAKPKSTGFSFSMLKEGNEEEEAPRSKRQRQE